MKQILRSKLFRNGTIYLLSKDEKFSIINFEGNSVHIDSENDFIEFTENSNYVRSRKDSTGYSIKDEILIKMSLKFHEVSVSGIAVCRNYDVYRDSLFKLPEEKQILSEWLPNRIFHIQDQYWINDTESDLKLIDVEKGEILWTIPQPKVEKPYGYNGLTNVKKVLGVYKDNLWIQLPDSRIRAVDIETGSITNELEHEYFIVHEDTLSLDIHSGNIMILGFDLYACFNLNLLTFTDELILPDAIRISKSNLHPFYGIAFTGRKDSREPNMYGIFDTKKKEVIFQGEEIEVDGHFYQEPQVNDELFTILDNKGNLIIHQMRDIIGGEK